MRSFTTILLLFAFIFNHSTQANIPIQDATESIPQLITNPRAFMNVFINPVNIQFDVPSTSCEIRAYSLSNELLGKNNFYSEDGTTGLIYLLINGANLTRGESIVFKFWNATSSIESELEIIWDENKSIVSSGVFESKYYLAATMESKSVDFKVPTSSDNIKQLHATIYPSPATDYINVFIPALGNLTLTIFNTNGETVRNQKINNYASDNLTIDVSDLSMGVYFLRVIISDKSYVHKFIVK